ncbi:MAG: SHOCT domain-containing protein [Actinomycetota bacterium]|nr:SHOCT domain-containing protein [Actinomycetota bacterium]
MPSSKALGILNERYAKGEINKEEYEQRKQALTKE